MFLSVRVIRERYEIIGSLTGMKMHHVALRVSDASASSEWLQTVLNFRVTTKFTVADMEFIWLQAANDEQGMVFELIGGEDLDRMSTADDIMSSFKQPGLHHSCLEVDDLDATMADIQKHGDQVKILLESIPGAPGSGVEKCAFIADPWGNRFEILQLAR